MSLQRLEVLATIGACVFTAFALIVGVVALPNFPLQLFGTVLFIIACSVIVVIGKRFRKFKRLVCRVVSEKIVLDVQESEEVRGRVQVILDNRAVKDVWLVFLNIWNSGNLPINPEDYNNNPIKISFRVGAKVLEAKVIASNPKRIQSLAEATLRLDSESVILDPLKLDIRNNLALQVLLTGYDGEVNMDDTQIDGGQVLCWDQTTFARLNKVGAIYLPIMTFIYFIIFINVTFLEGLFIYVFTLRDYIFNNLNLSLLLVIFTFILTFAFIILVHLFLRTVRPEYLPPFMKTQRIMSKQYTTVYQTMQVKRVKII